MMTSRSKIDPVYAEHHAPEFDDVMIDIETMSLHPHNALILSVGMIEFDPSGKYNEGPGISDLKIGARSLILPNLEQQLLMGREVSKGTQEFWRKQSREASAHWMDNEAGRMNIAGVCHHIELFCRGKSRVWANGTQFDLSNLAELNRQLGECGVGDLWHYQAPRDMRTFVKETPATRIVPIGDALDIPGVPHEPVYDCIAQAWQVWSHYVGR
jgi:hypothetical protein